MNTNKLTKIIGAIIGILGFIAFIAGATYAWISWQSDDINITGSSECFDIIHTNGTSLSRSDIILFDEAQIISNNKITVKEGMAYLNMTASISSDCNLNADLKIALTINELNTAYTSGNSVGALKYALVSYDPSTFATTESLIGGTFDIIANESVTEEPINFDNIALTTINTGYAVIFYIDGVLAHNDAGNTNFGVTISAKAVQRP